MDFILLSIGGQWGKTVQWGMYVKIGAQRLFVGTNSRGAYWDRQGGGEDVVVRKAGRGEVMRGNLQQTLQLLNPIQSEAASEGGYSFGR